MAHTFHLFTSIMYNIQHVHAFEGTMNVFTLTAHLVKNVD